MTNSTKIFYLLLAFFGMLIIPYIGAYVHLDGNFDVHYFDFPPLKPELIYKDLPSDKGGFNIFVFSTIAIIFLITIVFYLFPTIFGFKKKGALLYEAEARKKVAFPTWFWVGLIVWGFSLVFLAGHFSSPKWFLNWANIPLYWGLTFVLDGIVYKRTGGKSIFNNNPQELVGIGVASISGWLLFEYLNFFVLEYWYYPKGGLVPDPEFYTYAIFASSALLPLSFQLLSLFNSFPGFVNKYRHGPKIHLGKKIQIALLVLAYVGLFFMGWFPNYLCPVIWLSPLIILAVVLSMLEVWTPFEPIKKGSWTPVVFSALTYLVAGFLLEAQNYMSAAHPNKTIETEYPGYWAYNVPFVDGYHLFEMPIVGFYGYLPFGIYCLVWWIFFAFLLNIQTNFAKYEDPLY